MASGDVVARARLLACSKFSAWIVLFCLSVLTGAGCNSSASSEPDFSTKVDKLVDTAQTANQVPSICVAIGRKGKPIYAHCSGMIDLANNTPAPPESIYLIGSVTKQFTTTAIMMLANQKPPALSLSDPVSKYIPALSSDPGITIA